MSFLTQRGFSFGLTSGLITTLGLMVGLYSTTQSKLVVIGGILTIAVADAFSDALSMHISEEAQNNKSTGQIWKSTILTFISKLIFALIFIIAVIFLQLSTAIIVNIILALLILTVFNYLIAESIKQKPLNLIFEHVAITVAVVIITYYVGQLIDKVFV
jgi:vacuolar iron transporter family protein